MTQFIDDDKTYSHLRPTNTQLLVQSKGPLPLIFNFLFNFIDLSFHTVGNVGLTFQRQIKIHFAQTAIHHTTHWNVITSIRKMIPSTQSERKKRKEKEKKKETTVCTWLEKETQHRPTTHHHQPHTTTSTYVEHSARIFNSKLWKNSTSLRVNIGKKMPMLPWTVPYNNTSAAPVTSVVLDMVVKISPTWYWFNCVNLFAAPCTGEEAGKRQRGGKDKQQRLS